MRESHGRLEASELFPAFSMALVSFICSLQWLGTWSLFPSHCHNPQEFQRTSHKKKTSKIFSWNSLIINISKYFSNITNEMNCSLSRILMLLFSHNILLRSLLFWFVSIFQIENLRWNRSGWLLPRSARWHWDFRLWLLATDCFVSFQMAPCYFGNSLRAAIFQPVVEWLKHHPYLF